MSKGRNIPESIKRLVRKKCYFGCVICGNPIIEYEHIEEYHKVKKHEVSNLTLLCPTHHAMVTKKIISKKQVKEYTNNPYNKKYSFSPKMDIFISNTDEIKLSIGNNTFRRDNFNNGSEFICIEILKRKVISFSKKNGRLYLNICILDSKGYPIFIIYNNEMMFSLFNWDVTIILNRIKIIDQSNRTIVEIEIGEEIHINKLNIIYFGNEIKVENRCLKVNGNILSGIKTLNCNTAISIN